MSKNDQKSNGYHFPDVMTSFRPHYFQMFIKDVENWSERSKV